MLRNAHPQRYMGALGRKHEGIFMDFYSLRISAKTTSIPQQASEIIHNYAKTEFVSFPQLGFEFQNI